MAVNHQCPQRSFLEVIENNLAHLGLAFWFSASKLNWSRIKIGGSISPVLGSWLLMAWPAGWGKVGADGSHEAMSDSPAPQRDVGALALVSQFCGGDFAASVCYLRTAYLLEPNNGIKWQDLVPRQNTDVTNYVWSTIPTKTFIWLLRLNTNTINIFLKMKITVLSELRELLIHVQLC